MDMKPVLVTTEHRGIFFGYVKSDERLPVEITLAKVRNCIYWSSDVGGFLGLAAAGPNKNCRIGKQVDELRIFKITSVAPVNDGAAKAWEQA